MEKHSTVLFLWYILISILLSIGIAGIGYALNDLYDYKDDIINKNKIFFCTSIHFKKVFYWLRYLRFYQFFRGFCLSTGIRLFFFND